MSAHAARSLLRDLTVASAPRWWPSRDEGATTRVSCSLPISSHREEARQEPGLETPPLSLAKRAVLVAAEVGFEHDDHDQGGRSEPAGVLPRSLGAAGDRHRTLGLRGRARLGRAAAPGAPMRK